jgi:hypothetical protein
VVESLFARAAKIDLVECVLPSKTVVTIRRLCVRFGHASPDHLKKGTLPSSYTDKPLVTFNGDAMFGELAVLRWLEVDGWDGAWLDTVHDRKCWHGMPTRDNPVQLPPPAQALYKRIVIANRHRASGTFDVMAWRGEQHIFVEYEEGGEQLTRNNRVWIESAMSVGVSANDLLIVARDE